MSKFYTIERDTEFTEPELAMLQGSIITDLSNIRESASMLREQVLVLFEETLEVLRPVKKERMDNDPTDIWEANVVNDQHPLTHIYKEYGVNLRDPERIQSSMDQGGNIKTTPTVHPTEKEVDTYLEDIFNFENKLNRAIAERTNPMATVTLMYEDREEIITSDHINYYRLVKQSYPTNLNTMVVGATAPQNLKGRIYKHPAIFYGCSAIRPNAAFDRLGSVGETITIFLYGVVKDLSDKGTKIKVDDNGMPILDDNDMPMRVPDGEVWRNRNLFISGCNLQATLDNLVKNVRSDGLPQPDNFMGDGRVESIETTLESRPLVEGIGSAELLRFQIQINWTRSVDSMTMTTMTRRD